MKKNHPEGWIMGKKKKWILKGECEK